VHIPAAAVCCKRRQQRLRQPQRKGLQDTHKTWRFQQNAVLTCLDGAPAAPIIMRGQRMLELRSEAFYAEG
jgi:hypothetical protein